MLLRAQHLALASLLIAIAVLGLKSVAAWLTGSVALFADALESVVNVAAAGAALMAIRYAAMPPDANHPYGHDKAEYFSAVLEGALILVAAFIILHECWSVWNNPRTPELSLIAFCVALTATAVNAVWCAVLFKQGKRLRSPALLADARHLLADVVTSIGVLIGVALALASGLLWLDPLLAALTAVNILFSGARLVRESVGGLMDEALSPELLARIRATVAAEAEGAIEAHDIRSRQAGRSTFIEFHLVVPGEMRVVEAHAICDRVEAALKAELGSAIITIHVEPDNKAKHSGVLVL
jgi:cation diffusion facilitator family transporter